MNQAHPFIDTIRDYYLGCSSADEALMKSAFTDDVVHYFTQHPPIVGADALASYWLKMQPRIEASWYCDHALIQGDECVIEWTMKWRAPTGNKELMRGAEWYIFRDGKIAEIRAYYLNRHQPYERENFELDEFPYQARGYEVL